MKLFIMYVAGLAFIALTIYFNNPANKAGACAFFGLGMLIPAVLSVLIGYIEY
jgi:hypothetical protein